MKKDPTAVAHLAKIASVIFQMLPADAPDRECRAFAAKVARELYPIAEKRVRDFERERRAA